MDWPATQCTGMEVHMIPHKSRYEVVRVIIERSHVQGNGVSSFGGSGRKILRFKLFLQKSVSSSLKTI
jgi:hypothetical protein